MPTTIDIDVKIVKIISKPVKDGINTIFELQDANAPDTRLHLTFYRKQVDFILAEFDRIDRERMREELVKIFQERERKIKGDLMREYLDKSYEAEREVRADVAGKISELREQLRKAVKNAK